MGDDGAGKDKSKGYVRVVFDGGGAVGDVPRAVTLKVGQEMVIPSVDGLVKGEAFFDGWKAEGNNLIYCVGDKVRFSKDMKLVAQWIMMIGG